MAEWKEKLDHNSIAGKPSRDAELLALLKQVQEALFLGSTNIVKHVEETAYINIFFKNIAYQALHKLRGDHCKLNTLERMIDEAAILLETGVANCVEQSSYISILMILRYLKTGNPGDIPVNFIFYDGKEELLHRYVVIDLNRDPANNLDPKEYFTENSLALDLWLESVEDIDMHQEKMTDYFPEMQSVHKYDLYSLKYFFPFVSERLQKARKEFSQVFQSYLDNAILTDKEGSSMKKAYEYLLMRLKETDKDQSDKIHAIQRLIRFIERMIKLQDCNTLVPAGHDKQDKDEECDIPDKLKRPDKHERHHRQESDEMSPSIRVKKVKFS